MYHFSFGGVHTPAGLKAALDGFVEQARRDVSDHVSALTPTSDVSAPAYSDVSAADWAMQDVVGFAGSVWGGSAAAAILVHAPEFPATHETVVGAMTDPGTEEQWKWMLRVAHHALSVILREGRTTPDSRSTSLASNLREDYIRAFHTALYEALPLRVRIEAMEAEERLRQKQIDEWRAESERRRLDAEAAAHAKEEERRARRAERRAAKRAAS